MTQYAIALETTGTDTMSEIIKVSLVDMANDQAILDCLLDTDHCSPGRWQSIYRYNTGITPEMVAGKSCLFTEPAVRAKFSNLLCRADQLVAYSGDFVRLMLQISGIQHPPIYSLQDAFAEVYGLTNADGASAAKYQKFQTMCDFYGIGADLSTTLGKARATAACYRALSARIINDSPLGM